MAFGEDLSPMLEGSDWRRHNFQKSYLCSWIVAAFLPFTLLHVAFASDIVFPFQSASSSPINLQSEEHISLASEPDVKLKTTPESPTFIRPDEDAWITHDDGINHDLKTRDGKRKKDHQMQEERSSKDDEKAAQELEPNLSEERRQGGEQPKLEVIIPSEEQHEPEEYEKEKRHQVGGRIDEGTPTGECDLFEGAWEHDPEGPLYTNSTCFYIQEAQNCMSNGRPDTEYMYWRWKPRDCYLPQFDAKSFLKRFVGKAIGFIGDSIARNQMQSLLCLLSQVEIPTRTYASADNQNVRWMFKEHQVTVAVVWSSYLLKETRKGVMGFQKGQSVLYLDELDTSWTSMMTDFDVIVFLTGQWFYKSSVYIKEGEIVGCHYCPNLNLPEMGFYQAYRGAIRQVLNKVSNDYKGVAIMSTFPLSHFENGRWDTGGNCERELPLEPLESRVLPGDHNQMREIVVEEFNGVVNQNRELKKDARLDILDVTRVSLQRADGHPGPFRRPNPFLGRDPDVYYANDCLHWCLPGPLETWNQLVVEILGEYL